MNLKHLFVAAAVLALSVSPNLVLADKGPGGGGKGGGGNVAADVGGPKGGGNKGGGNVKGSGGGNVKSAPQGKAVPTQKSQKVDKPNVGKSQSQGRSDNRKVESKVEGKANVKTEPKVKADSKSNVESKARIQSDDRNKARVSNKARVDNSRQARSSYYRGNKNLTRNDSIFFGPRGYFGNNYLGNRSYNNYGRYGYGYGYGGWNGYGGYGLGYGYGPYSNRGFLPFLVGLGLGGAYGGYGYNDGYGTGTTIIDNRQVVVPPQEPVPPSDSKIDYVALGEAEFYDGRYDEALKAFRHALIEEPNNAGVMLLVGQALFQTSRWTEAAGATELAMGALPEESWGTVVQNHRELYGDIGDYTTQLRALEGAVKEKPNDPALRFLLGYHFGYLNYPKQAVRELGTAVELEGRDPAARRLHDIFAAKIGAPEVGPVAENLKPSAEAAQPAAADASSPPPQPSPPAPEPAR